LTEQRLLEIQIWKSGMTKSRSRSGMTQSRSRMTWTKSWNRHRSTQIDYPWEKINMMYMYL
jgi:hypothetical protein